MIGTTLHWVDGPWIGRLALAARPRGGDWLEEELRGWQRSGAQIVVSLLEADEENDLQLAMEGTVARSVGLDFRSVPIGDRQVPALRHEIEDALAGLEQALAGGRKVVLHCRQGVGRTGLMAACLLVHAGFDPESAVQRISAARGIPVPETNEQREWIDRYAELTAAAR